jgi:hypothetical protein
MKVDPVQNNGVKERYLNRAILEYEYSFAQEYDKTSITSKAAKEGTIDFDYGNASSDVELSRDGAWVKARVWVPKSWLDQE